MRLTVLKNSVPIDSVQVETSDGSERYEIYVGRAEDCHVRIDDPLISRHHFVIASDSNGWHCQKLSKLGTVTVNGKEDPSLCLQNGDEIKCGIYSVIVSDLGNHKPIRKVTNPSPLDEGEFVNPVPDDMIAPEHLGGGSDANDTTGKIEVDSSEMQGEEVKAEDQEYPEIGDPQIAQENSDVHNDQNYGESNSFAEESSEISPVETALDNPDFTDQSNSPVDEFGIAALEQDERTRVDQSFVNYELVLFGEHAPYDRYLIVDSETFIGRDSKKCQIVLTDPEVSTAHSVIKKNGSILLLEDLNSSNGTILNGERINRSAMMPGDEFVIGSTSFTLQVKSDLMDAEKDRLMPVEQGQVIEKEEIEEEIVDSDEAAVFDSNAPVEKSIIKRFLKNPEQRKKALYAVVGLCILWVLFDEDTPDVEATQKKTVKAPESKIQIKNQKPPLSKEQEQKRNTEYELGVAAFEASDFNKALTHFEAVNYIDSDYKNISTYLKQTKEAIKQLADFEKQRREEEERIKLKKVVDELITKAREAVKERQVQLAENLFAQITEKDPENMEVQQLKLEIEAWQKEEERKALELAAKTAARKRMVDALSPGKTLYLKKEWYKAIIKLEDFLRKQGMDEDLIKEASDMLSDSKNELASELGPVIGKARSLKEGQDLKAAYHSFQDVLKLEPTNAEALNEVDEIKNILESRSKKIYREAIIAESLSLFNDAKEKFQEVQQISPSDSDYYKKATEKLKNYLE